MTKMSMISVQRKFKHSVNVTIFRNCGKVMFSKACVKNSVQEGKVYTPQADTSLGRPPPRQTATAVDGTHLVKQECIPVGCLLSAVVVICWGRGSAQGVSARGCLPGRVSAREVCLPDPCPPPPL